MSFYADSNSTNNNQGGGFFSPGGSHTADGGYAGTPSDQFGSQQKKNKSKFNDKLVPVTISMIHRAKQDVNEDAMFRFNDVQEFGQVKFIGLITRVVDQSTHVVYTVTDGTGQIDVKVWNDKSEDEDGSSSASSSNVKFYEGSYVRVVGVMKIFNDKKIVQPFTTLLPVEDFNEITHHALETVFVHLKVTKGDSTSSKDDGDVSTKTYDDVSGGGGGGGDMDKLQNEVLQVFTEHSAQGDQGLDIKRAVEMLVSKGYVANEIRKAIGFLTDEGHLYSTIDENHLKTT